MLYNPWPEILREARTARGFSQENAAARAGVSEITWYRWEKGSIHPGHKTLDALARGVDLDAALLAMRYAQALLDHYQDFLGDPPAAEGPPTGATVTADRLPTAPDATQRLSQPTLIRGLSSEGGAVWVDFNQIVELMWQHRPPGFEDQPRPRPAVWSRRRRDPSEP